MRGERVSRERGEEHWGLMGGRSSPRSPSFASGTNARMGYCVGLLLVGAGFFIGHMIWQQLQWRQVVRFIRKERGYCLNCGYDLRFSEDRCPECGVLRKP